MSETSITSELLWWSALVTALVDTPLVLVIARFVSPDLFGRLKWYLAGVACALYAAIWASLGSLIFWDTVYSAIFPAWMRWLLGPFYGLLFGALALLFWSLSRHARNWPAAWFCLLGGLVSLVGHSIGFSRGLLRVPMLIHASALSALAFGVFEFIFYWCAIVGLAAAARWIRVAMTGGRIPGAIEK